MTLIELINKIGQSNIQVQYLAQCLTKATWKRKMQVTEVSFITQESVMDGEMVGMILWIPKNKVDEIKDE